MAKVSTILDELTARKLTANSLLCYIKQTEIGWEYECAYFKNQNSFELDHVNELKLHFFSNPLPRLAEKLIEKALGKETDLVERLFIRGKGIGMEVITGDFPLLNTIEESPKIKPFTERQMKKYADYIYNLGGTRYLNQIIQRKKQITTRAPTF